MRLYIEGIRLLRVPQYYLLVYLAVAVFIYQFLPMSTQARQCRDVDFMTIIPSIPNKYYYPNHGGCVYTFEEAVKLCNKSKAYISEPVLKVENDFLTYIARKYFHNAAPYGQIWIGLKRDEKKSQWYWMRNKHYISPTSWNNWAPNTKVSDTGYGVYLLKNDLSNGTWHIAQADSSGPPKKYVICEFSRFTGRVTFKPKTTETTETTETTTTSASIVDSSSASTGTTGKWKTEPTSQKRYIDLNIRGERYGGNQQACFDIDAFLPEPKNKIENDFLAKLTSKPFRLGMHHQWDSYGNHVWIFESGAGVAWHNWVEFLKKRVIPLRADRRCAAMVKGRWDDVDCYSYNGTDTVVCEKEPADPHGWRRGMHFASGGADGKLQPPAMLISAALGLCRLIHYM